MWDQWSPIRHCFLFRGSKYLQVVHCAFNSFKIKCKLATYTVIIKATLMDAHIPF